MVDSEFANHASEEELALWASRGMADSDVKDHVGECDRCQSVFSQYQEMKMAAPLEKELETPLPARVLEALVVKNQNPNESFSWTAPEPAGTYVQNLPLPGQAEILEGFLDSQFHLFGHPPINQVGVEVAKSAVDLGTIYGRLFNLVHALLWYRRAAEWSAPCVETVPNGEFQWLRAQSGLAMALGQLEDHDSAMEGVDNILSRPHLKENHPDIYARTQLYRSHLYRYQQDFGKSQAITGELLSFEGLVENSLLHGQLLESAGILGLLTKQWENAKNYFEGALKIYEVLGHKDHIVRCEGKKLSALFSLDPGSIGVPEWLDDAKTLIEHGLYEQACWDLSHALHVPELTPPEEKEIQKLIEMIRPNLKQAFAKNTNLAKASQEMPNKPFLGALTNYLLTRLN